MTTMTEEQIETYLANFTGTEQYHKYGPLQLTDGVKWLVDNLDCYWLLDILTSYQKQCLKDEMLQEFQVWTLKVNPKKPSKYMATIICERDTNDVFLKQDIEYTDFPISQIKLYVINGVCLLTSEY